MHRLDQRKDVLTPSRNAASSRVTIDLNLIADTDIDVAVGTEGETEAEGDVEVLGVPAIITQSSTVKEGSSSSSSSAVKNTRNKSNSSAVKRKSSSNSSSAMKDSSNSSSACYTDPSPEELERVRAQEQSDLASRRLAKRLSRGYVTLHCIPYRVCLILCDIT